MARIVVLGGTGYAGSHIVRAAVDRGHEVISYSRKAPESPVAGAEYRPGDVSDDALILTAVDGADVVVSALSPRGELEGAGALRAIEKKIADTAAAKGVRFGVVGGAGSLLVAEGGPRVVDTPGFPEAVKPEATEMGAILDDLRAYDESLDWFFVSPAGGFGAFAPGEATGTYRVGGDILLVSEDGQSFISGPDFALAVLDEIEKPAHRRARFTVAY